jgi:hypothetical protein
MKTDGVQDEVGERPRFSYSVPCTTILLRLAPTARSYQQRQAADGRAAAHEDDDEDGGLLTLTALSTAKLSTEFSIRLPLRTVPVLTDESGCVP